jgi:hypothetical protein
VADNQRVGVRVDLQRLARQVDGNNAGWGGGVGWGGGRVWLRVGVRRLGVWGGGLGPGAWGFGWFGGVARGSVFGSWRGRERRHPLPLPPLYCSLPATIARRRPELRAPEQPMPPRL